MSPRLRLRPLARALEASSTSSSRYVCARCSYATATATVPAPSQDQLTSGMPQLSRHHPLQPPSHRDPKYRKAQMLRSYVSLLQTTPLMLFFQHNNLKAMEWASIRRELARALEAADKSLPDHADLADSIKLQVIQTKMFEPALRITEHFDPSDSVPEELKAASFARPRDDPTLTHVLSSRAYNAAKARDERHELATLLQGSIAVLTLPIVSPQHLAAAMRILAPNKPAFPAPTRRSTPSYYEPAVQDGLRKLLLLGARVEGKVFDQDGVRWIGGIDGGLEGLRAQLVSLLQMAGVGLTGALEGLGKNLWMTLESRRQDMEEKAGEGAK
ncbi:uncharacterized protein AB675_5332 [Cyphellophora attinorum]|uniref:54S ribosomal protein L11, mitochondrial n=1 Tax=Cyphellophora attinorum TaxID=1664694 RepID=A0A0N1HT70_9EURO|nr:uncharacterized protein AB675_5332 [Phialophora attinorum]KPI42100.1 hypothetical protein AB675_5332 [Phialophora attinorum]